MYTEVTKIYMPVNCKLFFTTILLFEKTFFWLLVMQITKPSFFMLYLHFHLMLVSCFASHVEMWLIVILYYRDIIELMFRPVK